MTKEELINDDHDGLNIPETRDEQWFVDMVNEPDSAPESLCWEEYYERSAVPEYIIASTSDMAGETYVFEANADGNILSYDEYGGLAERWGDVDHYVYSAKQLGMPELPKVDPKFNDDHADLVRMFTGA